MFSYKIAFSRSPALTAAPDRRRRFLRRGHLGGIPAIAGAGLLTALYVSGGFQMPLPVALAGLTSSFAVGVVALKWLLGWLEQGKFHYFGIYCLVVGLITLVV
jgi:undecaprenyl-diphosphatase